MNEKAEVVTIKSCSSSTLLLMACGGKDTSKGTDSSTKKGEVEQVFKTVVPQEMPTMDVSLNSDVISATATNSVYEGLYRFNGEGLAEPAGASEAADISEDGLVYTFKLRENAKWSDGQPLTAKDYVYSWQRGVNPDTGSEYGFLFNAVKNGEAALAGNKEVAELGVRLLVIMS